MKSVHQKILILSIALIALAWTAWQKLEWVEERSWVAAEAEVNNRPMLAAGLFLQSLGFSVSRIVDQKRFDDIPDDVETLFICEGKLQLSESHFDEIQRWLEAGGHLVINSSGGGRLHSHDEEEGDQDYGVRSKPVADVHESLGIRRGNDAALQDCWRQRVDFDPESEDRAVDYSDVVEAVMTGGASPASDSFNTVFYEGELPGRLDSDQTTVEFEGANWLLGNSSDGVDWSWPSKRGSQLLSQPVGDGRLTVLSDFSPFFNSGVGEYDNAFALQSIVQSVATAGSLVWFHERELAFPSLFSLLWKRAPETLLLMALAIVLIVWALFARRKEPITARTVSTSQLRQQLYAVALYRWRVGDMAGFSQALEQKSNSQPLPGDVDTANEQSAETMARSKGLLVEQARAHWHAANKLRGKK